MSPNVRTRLTSRILIVDQKDFTPKHYIFLRFGLHAALRMEYDQEVVRLQREQQVSLVRSLDR